jgi:hypothetical protein
MVLFTCVLFINKPYLILTYQMRMLTIILQLQLHAKINSVKSFNQKEDVEGADGRNLRNLTMTSE